MQRSWPFNRIGLFDEVLSGSFGGSLPHFALLIGDNVYTDAPPKLRPQVAYEKLLNDPSFRALTESVPTMFQFDDHEIKDNADNVSSDEFLSGKNDWGAW